MPDRAAFAKGLAAAASFFHEFGELAADAETQFLDACVAVAPSSSIPTPLGLR